MQYTFTRAGYDAGAPEGLGATMEKVRRKAVQWGPRYQVKSPDQEWSPEFGRLRLYAKLRWQLPRGAEGDAWKVRVGTSRTLPAVYRIVKVAVEQPVRATLYFYTGRPVDLSEGNPRIAYVGQWAAERFSRVRCAGYAYTRYIAGTSIWSQHSRFPEGCNALDLTIYEDDDPNEGWDEWATKQMAQVFVANGAGLRLRQVIVGDTVYRSDDDWHPAHYSGVYHTHVHLEAEPYATGTPVDA